MTKADTVVINAHQVVERKYCKDISRVGVTSSGRSLQSLDSGDQTSLEKRHSNGKVFGSDDAVEVDREKDNLVGFSSLQIARGDLGGEKNSENSVPDQVLVGKDDHEKILGYHAMGTKTENIENWDTKEPLQKVVKQIPGKDLHLDVPYVEPGYVKKHELSGVSSVSAREWRPLREEEGNSSYGGSTEKEKGEAKAHGNLGRQGKARATRRAYVHQKVSM